LPGASGATYGTVPHPPDADVVIRSGLSAADVELEPEVLEVEPVGVDAVELPLDELPQAATAVAVMQAAATIATRRVRFLFLVPIV
jgi:hypothetical protein